MSTTQLDGLRNAYFDSNFISKILLTHLVSSTQTLLCVVCTSSQHLALGTRMSYLDPHKLVSKRMEKHSMLIGNTTTSICMCSYSKSGHAADFWSRFVDRDIFMRSRGGGIGRKATHEWDGLLQQDPGKAVEEESDDEMEESQDKEVSDLEIAEEELEEWEAVMA